MMNPWTSPKRQTKLLINDYGRSEHELAQIMRISKHNFSYSKVSFNCINLRKTNTKRASRFTELENKALNPDGRILQVFQDWFHSRAHSPPYEARTVSAGVFLPGCWFLYFWVCTGRFWSRVNRTRAGIWDIGIFEPWFNKAGPSGFYNL